MTLAVQVGGDAHTRPSYRRVCKLASGGMGSVELALRVEGSFQRLYAIKRLHPHLRDDPAFRAMFLDEARIAGLIQHPNVVGVLDVGEDENGPFLIMDYVDGFPLHAVLALQREAGEPLPIQMCVRIGIEIARGLHAAHELVGHDGRSLCVVHRDLSPHNVLIGFDGAVRITDFGIAKAIGRSSYTATGVVKGKLSYMSPEQLRFEELDRRSDLFSLGVVLYELLSGERLYRNASGADEPHRLLNEPPPDIGEVRPEVPGTLTELLFDLLAKEPELRPQTSHEVAVVLEGVFAELVAGGPPMDLERYLRHLTRGAFQERKRTLADAIARAGEAARADDTESAPVAIDPNASTTEMRRRLRPSRVGLLLGAIVLAAVVLGALGLSLVPPAATTPPNADEPESAPIAPATEAHAGEAPVAADETAEAHTTAPEDPAAATPPATAPEAPSVRTLPDRRRTPRKRRSAARTTKTPGLELRAWDGDSR